MARLRNLTRYDSNPEEDDGALPLLNTPQPPPEEPRERPPKPWDFDGFLEGVDQVGSRLREAGILTSDDKEGDLLPLSTPQPPPALVAAPENAPAVQVEAEEGDELPDLSIPPTATPQAPPPAEAEEPVVEDPPAEAEEPAPSSSEDLLAGLDDETLPAFDLAEWGRRFDQARDRRAEKRQMAALLGTGEGINRALFGNRASTGAADRVRQSGDQAVQDVEADFKREVPDPMMQARIARIRSQIALDKGRLAALLRKAEGRDLSPLEQARLTKLQQDIEKNERILKTQARLESLGYGVYSLDGTFLGTPIGRGDPLNSIAAEQQRVVSRANRDEKDVDDALKESIHAMSQLSATFDAVGEGNRDVLEALFRGDAQPFLDRFANGNRFRAAAWLRILGSPTWSSALRMLEKHPAPPEVRALLQQVWYITEDYRKQQYGAAFTPTEQNLYERLVADGDADSLAALLNSLGRRESFRFASNFRRAQFLASGKAEEYLRAVNARQFEPILFSDRRSILGLTREDYLDLTSDAGEGRTLPDLGVAPVPPPPQQVQSRSPAPPPPRRAQSSGPAPSRTQPARQSPPDQPDWVRVRAADGQTYRIRRDRLDKALTTEGSPYYGATVLE